MEPEKQEIEQVNNGFEFILDWIKSNSGKLIFFAVTMVIAYLCTRVVTRLVRNTLERSKVPDASIFINLARVIIWALALTIVLKPVFGINPMTLFTALGIGGFAISLGLQPSIANIFAGFQLMFSHVLEPGDIVSISGATGVVQDVTWRQTVVKERNGNVMLIPNSVLNTTSLEKLQAYNENCATIPFIAKPRVDTDALTKEILATINEEAKDLMDPKNPPSVKFTGFTALGITGNISVYAKNNVFLSTLTDRVTRSVSNSEFFTDFAASGDDMTPLDIEKTEADSHK